MYRPIPYSENKDYIFLALTEETDYQGVIIGINISNLECSEEETEEGTAVTFSYFVVYDNGLNIVEGDEKLGNLLSTIFVDILARISDLLAT